MHKKPVDELRSNRWFKQDDLRSFGHRSRVKQMGYWGEEFVGKPVIAIINTWNDLNTCHSHFPERVKDIKRGITAAGGFPVELPAMSLGEQLMKPSAMMYRNMLAMEVEELLRSYPVDGAVVMGGCDKTTPGVLMGAISMNLPTIYVPAGAMLRGNYRGQVLGSGTDVWKYWDERRIGNVSDNDWSEIENGIARSPGTCMTMGTAATLMSIGESLGMSLPGASSIPAVDANHNRMCYASGKRAVEMVWEDLKPTDVMSEASFDNAIAVDMAIGGSTNAIIHIVAMARRLGFSLPMERFNEISRRVPLVLNLKPSGEYLMEDFFYAGGLPALMTNIGSELKLSAMTVTGRTLGDNIEGAKVWRPEVILPLDSPVDASGGTAVLTGSLAPKGAIIKPTAADPRLHVHQGPAYVFENIADLKARIDDEDLPVTADSIIVLKNGGPVGGPGMPEWGMMPIPAKLLKQGVRDMLRISDSRMSGTSYGSCILHVAPEAAVGGPLAIVQTGDIIAVDVPNRRLDLMVDEEEIQRRLADWQPPRDRHPHGYASLYKAHVTQADEGCDFDFANGAPGSTPEPDIY